jgi:hypothetical protein
VGSKESFRFFSFLLSLTHHSLLSRCLPFSSPFPHVLPSSLPSGGLSFMVQNAVKYFDHGVDHGVIRIESNSQSTWEDAVCNIHNSASILEDISGLVRRETSSESVASTVQSLGVWHSLFLSILLPRFSSTLPPFSWGGALLCDCAHSFPLWVGSSCHSFFVGEEDTDLANRARFVFFPSSPSSVTSTFSLPPHDQRSVERI